MKDWIEAFRLRTLPLALSSIGMGSFLAAKNGIYRWEIFILCALTTVFLQILSNLANDYGDTQNGADNVERQGPTRTVQTGAISSKAMFNAIIVFIIYLPFLLVMFQGFAQMRELLEQYLDLQFLITASLQMELEHHLEQVLQLLLLFFL